MSKMITFLLITLGVLILFHYTGIIQEGEGSVLLNYALHPQNIRNLDLSSMIVLSIATLGGIGAIALSIYSGNPELIIMSGIALFMWNLVLDMLVIYNKIASTSTELAVIIFAAPIVVFLIVIIDWWRGRG